MFDLDALRRHLQGFEGHRKLLAEKKATLIATRNALMAAPAARSDVKETLSKWVDRTAAGFTEALTRDLGEFVRRPQTMGDTRVSQVVSLVGSPAAPGLDFAATRAGDAGQSAQVDRALCALFGPELKATLFAGVDAMAWPAKEGLPLAARLAEVEKLDRQIEKLETEERELEEQAASAGVRL
jgi:hypothetical protein